MRCLICFVLLPLIISAGACSPNHPIPVAAIGTSVPSATPRPAPKISQTVYVSTPSTSLIGIEIDKTSSTGGLDLVANSGACWIRRNVIYWSDIEPLEGQRNWENVSNLEQELQNASQQGLQVILIVRSTPYWAQKFPGVYCGPVKEDKLSAFASFMHDLVARYSAPPYDVKYYESGNEPDVDPSLFPPDNIFGCHEAFTCL